MYIYFFQICNWFANWRRKLKNTNSEKHLRTWSILIKNYNSQAQGNVEQFSICSDDSIWEDKDLSETGKTKNIIACRHFRVINFLQKEMI